MLLKDQIVASKEAFMKAMKDYPQDEPVTMINILKFKAKTGRGEETGQEAYKVYSKNVASLVKKAGAEVVWAGEVKGTIIGDYTDQPHMLLLVKYPNMKAFMDMAISEAYQKVKHDREIALEYGGLLPAMQIPGLG
ncbi:MAG: DUF1330 domain-containing protein [Bacteroidia bacterium]|nr:DUF1330 domain-containing protein [Bacteroidia bacterium]